MNYLSIWLAVFATVDLPVFNSHIAVSARLEEGWLWPMFCKFRCLYQKSCLAGDVIKVEDKRITCECQRCKTGGKLIYVVIV
ncbi:hypothetical protein Y032_0643g1048 [Ancylostoma ceylanicum]|uniref:Uncharacterized protein n=1 Tax=Ancylostoma ceylanicum TaxID=53326 RepID=A0A016WK97_9BILA|nr:hypothetical protein Y032_0643g1048 [Ancylostoma ceylanicum]